MIYKRHGHFPYPTYRAIMQTGFKLPRRMYLRLITFYLRAAKELRHSHSNLGGCNGTRDTYGKTRCARILIISYKDVIVLYCRARRPDRYVFRRYRYLSENYIFPLKCLRDIGATVRENIGPYYVTSSR